MHQILFRLGVCSKPRWGAHSAPPDLLAGFGASYFYGKGREGKGRRGKKEGRGEGGCVMADGKRWTPLFKNAILSQKRVQSPNL